MRKIYILYVLLIFFAFSGCKKDEFGSIGGTVLNIEELAAYVDVFLYKDDAIIFQTITNEEGVFAFNNLKPDKYQIQARIPIDNGNFDFTEKTDVLVTADQSLEINLNFMVDLAIEGYVFDTSNKAPYEGVTVQISGGSKKVSLSTSSDFRGYFAFYDLPFGIYQLVFTDGYETYEMTLNFKGDKIKTLMSFINLRDHDGNVYKTVQIGEQLWMAENLKTTHYADGTAIPLISTDADWAALGNNNTDDAYCFIDNSVYGALYTWAAAMQHESTSGVQGICPNGWHLPSDTEWVELTDYLGGVGVAGGKLKETGYLHWKYNTDGGATNESGFTGLPGGWRTDDGQYDYQTKRAYWWTSSEKGSKAWCRYVSFSNAEAKRTSYQKSYGLSVRCVKD